MWISVRPILHAVILELVPFRRFVSSERYLLALTFAIAALQVVTLLEQTSLEPSSPKRQPRRFSFHPNNSESLTGRLKMETSRREARVMTMTWPKRSKIAWSDGGP